MKRSSVVVRLIVLVLVLGLICGGTLVNAAPKPITFTIFIGAPGQQPTPDNKIYKLIEKELGVSLKFEFLVGDLEQKMGVMIAGGDYPDVVSGHTRFINAGALIPLEDLIKKNCPTLWKHYLPYLNMVKEPSDGHFYIMPNYGRNYGDYKSTDSMGPGFFIQKAVLKEFGYPKIKTLDDYFDLIEKYKAKYPTIDGMPTIGFEILGDGWRNWGLKNPPQHLIGHPNDGNVVVDYLSKKPTYKAEIFADKDYAKRYYKKLNDMNAKGLIDRETFTLTWDQFMAKMSSGRVLGTFDQKWNFLDAYNSLIMQKKDERTWVATAPVFDPKTTKDWYMDRTVLNLNNGFGITKNCKDPVRFLKFLDAILSEKWQKILNWGIKGQDYMVDKNGVFYRTQPQRDNGNNLTWKLANKADALMGYCPKIEGTFKDGNAAAVGNQPGEFYDGLSAYDKEFLSGYKFKTWTNFYSMPPPNPIPYPAWQINLIDGSAAKICDTKMNDTSMKWLPQVILADPKDFDKLWDQYVAELHKLDIKAYEERINEQIQFRLKTWSPPNTK